MKPFTNECEYCKRKANWLLCEPHLKEKTNKPKKEGAIKELEVLAEKIYNEKTQGISPEDLISFIDLEIEHIIARLTKLK